MVDEGVPTPPLLTSSSAGTAATQAGVLGDPGTNVLFGGKDLGGGFLPGERIASGTWLNSSQTWGVEGSYVQLNRQAKSYTFSGDSTSILARPFFNVTTGQQDSLLVNDPGQQSGTFSANVASNLQVVDVLLRRNLNRGPELAVDLLGGYRFQQLNDHLELVNNLSFSGSQAAFPAGSTIQQADRFDARNTFQGGVVGIATSFHHQSWDIDASLKIAIGQTHSHLDIEGTTATIIPGQGSTFLPGGVLALPSNIGTQDAINSRSSRSGHHVRLRSLAAVAGNHRLRPGVLEWRGTAGQADRPEHRSAAVSTPAVTNAARPEFSLHTSDYWAQGLNLGLDFRF